MLETPSEWSTSTGSVLHPAWRTADEEEQLRRYDRKYFRSAYFRMPGGLLLELATDGAGFAVDEPEKSLGEALALPPWLEGDRPRIERQLTPIS